MIFMGKNIQNGFITPSISVANTNDIKTLVLKSATNIYTAYIFIYFAFILVKITKFLTVL